ncbi:alpha-glucosidase [Mucilaginibacter gracilis]|uniref:Alpha-glucosidase n=1 Tax=Mucilaginibacter gracilis TaxID=423350 RepID=A0A495J822_9SPHI|nr:glycoside hydrolase family 97 protein [Mucilaginibacter gracilis]RKR84588.1 alpha-glucosidase [Mucilaginibacter gracilis]
MKKETNQVLLKLVLSTLLGCFTSLGCLAQTIENIVVKSPDEGLKVAIFIKKDAAGVSKLYYSVASRAEQVILPSELGIGIWNNDLQIKSALSSHVNNTWKPLYAERNNIKDEYNQTIITLNKVGISDELQVIFRAYNEGFALRYKFPKINQAERYFPVTSDNTQFTFPEGATAWFEPAVESPYMCLPLKNWPGQSEGPLTLKLKSTLYVALGEAAQINFPIIKYSVKAENPNTIFCNLQSAVPDSKNGSLISPWRYVLIAEKPGKLLENNFLVQNLNAPSQIKDTKWIKPGKMIREVSLSYQGCKKLIDYAYEHHVQYILLDAGWYGAEFRSKELSDATKPKPELNLPDILAYAKEKHIGIWLYVNRVALDAQLDDILPLYEKWGVAGIKFGFVRAGTFQAISWLHDAVQKCAQHHLMVDIHDEYRPSGYTRTYPNQLTQEGVRGNEQMPDANNNTILPFTRFIAGPADYTLCYYDKRIKTSRAHQLALAAVYYSPLQTLYWYDKPYEIKAGLELEFWDKIPTVWDDTHVVQGEIGQYITVARRSGNAWFIGSLTNNDARELQYALTFLEAGKKYIATIYSEDDKATAIKQAVKVDRFIVTSLSMIKMNLTAGGGCAVMIEPADQHNSKGIVNLP